MKHVALLLVFVACWTVIQCQTSDSVLRSMFLTGNGVYPYKLWVPRNYTASKTYPLVTFLHGIGECNLTNGGQLRNTPVILARDVYQERFPHFILAPIIMIPAGQTSCPSWSPANVVSLTRSIQQNYSIDVNQTYITGFSWGSFGTWNTIEGNNAGFFKKAVPIAGMSKDNIPNATSTHGRTGRSSSTVNPTQVANLAKISVWAFHGEADTTVNWTRTRSIVDAMKQAGQLVGWTHPPNIRHDDAWVWTQYPTVEWLLNATAYPSTTTSFPTDSASTTTSSTTRASTTSSSTSGTTRASTTSSSSGGTSTSSSSTSTSGVANTTGALVTGTSGSDAASTTADIASSVSAAVCNTASVVTVALMFVSLLF